MASDIHASFDADARPAWDGTGKNLSICTSPAVHSSRPERGKRCPMLPVPSGCRPSPEVFRQGDFPHVPRLHAVRELAPDFLVQDLLLEGFWEL